MDKKKRLTKEIIWFICSVIGGLILSLFLYRLLDLDINLVVLVLGAIVAVIAIYVVRLTLWVLKESM